MNETIYLTASTKISKLVSYNLGKQTHLKIV